MKFDPAYDPLVCSNHHQAVDKLGKDMQVSAFSTDGKIVEAINHAKFKNVIGVQFHPEVPTLYQPDGPEYVFSPNDTTKFREYDRLMKSNSLEFHLKFWEYFSNLFQD
jgi:putative glutamine amidotransferase